MEKQEKINFIIKIIVITLTVLMESFFFVPIFNDGNIISLFGKGNPLLIIFYIVMFLGLASSCVFILKDKINDSKNYSALIYIVFGFSLIVAPDFNNSLIGSFNKLSGFGVVYVVLAFVLAFFKMLRSYNKNQFSIHDIVETAMLVALAIALDLPGLKIRIGANGGSISFTMIPLIILALRQGFAKGFLSIGIVYGFVTCLLDGWGLYTFPFDYLLAYGSLAIIGLFNNKLFYNLEDNTPTKRHYILLSLGVVIITFSRLLFATLSGVIFYETNFGASLSLNSLYILPSGAVSLVAMLLLYRPLIKINDLMSHKQI